MPPCDDYRPVPPKATFPMDVTFDRKPQASRMHQANRTHSASCKWCGGPNTRMDDPTYRWLDREAMLFCSDDCFGKQRYWLHTGSTRAEVEALAEKTPLWEDS